MKRILFTLIILFALAIPAMAQGNLGGCTVVDWHTGAPVTTPAAGQDLRVTCPRLFDGLSELQVFVRLLIVFEKSGYQVRPFQLNKFLDQFGVRVPLEAVGATQLIVYKLGYGSYLVNFTPPVVTSAPVLIAVKSFALERIEVPPVPIINGVLQRTRFRYLIIFGMDNVGAGGTFLFHFVKRDGTEILRLGQVFPRSSGLPDPQGGAEIYDDEIGDVVGVYVTDPNDSSVPASNTLPLAAVTPSTP